MTWDTVGNKGSMKLPWCFYRKMSCDDYVELLTNPFYSISIEIQ